MSLKGSFFLKFNQAETSGSQLYGIAIKNVTEAIRKIIPKNLKALKGIQDKKNQNYETLHIDIFYSIGGHNKNMF
jgi:hypothetical protein